jgi:hypothetical protein
LDEAEWVEERLRLAVIFAKQEQEKKLPVRAVVAGSRKNKCASFLLLLLGHTVLTLFRPAEPLNARHIAVSLRLSSTSLSPSLTPKKATSTFSPAPDPLTSSQNNGRKNETKSAKPSEGKRRLSTPRKRTSLAVRRRLRGAR